MYKNFHRVLRILMIVSVIVAAWALALNQFASFVQRGHEGALQNAEAACLVFNAPHAVIADGRVYCYAVFEGSEQIAPLDRLQAAAQKE